MRVSSLNIQFIQILKYFQFVVGALGPRGVLRLHHFPLNVVRLEPVHRPDVLGEVTVGDTRESGEVKLMFQVAQLKTPHQKSSIVVKTDAKHKDQENYDRFDDKQVELPDILWSSNEKTNYHEETKSHEDDC